MTNQRRIIAVFIVIVSAAACRPMSHREHRELLLQHQRQQLRQQIQADHDVWMRFRQLKPGTPAADVEKQLGSPGTTAPCANVEECSYYDISGQKYFVCFDKQGTVVCRGKTYLFR